MPKRFLDKMVWRCQTAWEKLHANLVSTTGRSSTRFCMAPCFSIFSTLRKFHGKCFNFADCKYMSVWMAPAFERPGLDRGSHKVYWWCLSSLSAVRGVQQMVNLGAGVDTRPLPLGHLQGVQGLVWGGHNRSASSLLATLSHLSWFWTRIFSLFKHVQTSSVRVLGFLGEKLGQLEDV